MTYEGAVEGEIPTQRTYISFPDDDKKKVVLECGGSSIEVTWRELFLLIEHLARKRNRRDEEDE